MTHDKKVDLISTYLKELHNANNEFGKFVELISFEELKSYDSFSITCIVVKYIRVDNNNQINYTSAYIDIWSLLLLIESISENEK